MSRLPVEDLRHRATRLRTKTGIQGRERLVQEHQVRVSSQRTRERHPLLLTPESWCGRRSTISGSSDTVSRRAVTCANRAGRPWPRRRSSPNMMFAPMLRCGKRRRPASRTRCSGGGRPPNDRLRRAAAHRGSRSPSHTARSLRSPAEASSSQNRTARLRQWCCPRGRSTSLRSAPDGQRRPSRRRALRGRGCSTRRLWVSSSPGCDGQSSHPPTAFRDCRNRTYVIGADSPTMSKAYGAALM